MLVQVQIQTVAQSFEAGTVGGDWQFDIYDADNALVESEKRSAPVAQFDLPAGENYRADVSRRNDTGALLGPIKSATFDVSDTTPVEIQVADGVVVTQLS